MTMRECQALPFARRRLVPREERDAAAPHGVVEGGGHGRRIRRMLRPRSESTSAPSRSRVVARTTSPSNSTRSSRMICSRNSSVSASTCTGAARNTRASAATPSVSAIASASADASGLAGSTYEALRPLRMTKRPGDRAVVAAQRHAIGVGERRQESGQFRIASFPVFIGYPHLSTKAARGVSRLKESPVCGARVARARIAQQLDARPEVHVGRVATHHVAFGEQRGEVTSHRAMPLVGAPEDHVSGDADGCPLLAIRFPCGVRRPAGSSAPSSPNSSRACAKAPAGGRSIQRNMPGSAIPAAASSSARGARSASSTSGVRCARSCAWSPSLQRR